MLVNMPLNDHRHHNFMVKPLFDYHKFVQIHSCCFTGEKWKVRIGLGFEAIMILAHPSHVYEIVDVGRDYIFMKSRSRESVYIGDRSSRMC